MLKRTRSLLDLSGLGEEVDDTESTEEFMGESDDSLESHWSKAMTQEEEDEDESIDMEELAMNHSILSAQSLRGIKVSLDTKRMPFMELVYRMAMYDRCRRPYRLVSSLFTDRLGRMTDLIIKWEVECYRVVWWNEPAKPNRTRREAMAQVLLDLRQCAKDQYEPPLKKSYSAILCLQCNAINPPLYNCPHCNSSMS